jgi:hypothetical protein
VLSATSTLALVMGNERRDSGLGAGVQIRLGVAALGSLALLAFSLRPTYHVLITRPQSDAILRLT